MGLLKVVVFGMGALIAVGIVILAYGLSHHWSSLTGSTPAPAATGAASPGPGTAVSGSPAAVPATVTLPPPEGMHFEQMATTGGMVVLRFAGPQGQRIVAIDPRTGQVSATISVPPGSP